MSEELTFDILGFKLKVRSSDIEQGTSAQEVVDFVRESAMDLKEKSPHLDNGEIAILLALKYAKEKLSLEREYQENVKQLHETARDALERIEESHLSAQ